MVPQNMVGVLKYQLKLRLTKIFLYLEFTIKNSIYYFKI